MSRSPRPSSSVTSNRASQPLKIVFGDNEYSLRDSLILIGRHPDCTIPLPKDLQVSGKHAQIKNGFLSDTKSTNGTLVNDRLLRAEDKPVLLRRGDLIQCGESIFRIEAGEAKPRANQELSRSKKFAANDFAVNGHMQTPRPSAKGKPASPQPVEAVASAQSIEEMMDTEFNLIIGHDSIKSQLRQFHKKVQLDRIRIAAGKEKDAKRLYHMIFSGPPGTGKTTMANLVAKLLLEMKLVENSNVVFVNNSLELLGSYVGQTPAKVDAKVAEAAGGVLFIDEAYSIVKEGGSREGSSFGKEAIDTIMKHLDPPSCVFIFAGYEAEMEQFLAVNPGLARRIPYRYSFKPYDHEQLQAIFNVMCETKGETLAPGCSQAFQSVLSSLPDTLLQDQNAGLVWNWLAFAQMERDDRIDLNEAVRNPSIASTIEVCDVQKAAEKVRQMQSSKSRVTTV